MARCSEKPDLIQHQLRTGATKTSQSVSPGLSPSAASHHCWILTHVSEKLLSPHRVSCEPVFLCIHVEAVTEFLTQVCCRSSHPTIFCPPRYCSRSVYCQQAPCSQHTSHRVKYQQFTFLSDKELRLPQSWCLRSSPRPPFPLQPCTQPGWQALPSRGVCLTCR